MAKIVTPEGVVKEKPKYSEKLLTLLENAEGVFEISRYSSEWSDWEVTYKKANGVELKAKNKNLEKALEAINEAV